MKYCEDCKQESWPKGPSYNHWGKCDVCGTMKFCYNGPDTLKREVEPTRADWTEPVAAVKPKPTPYPPDTRFVGSERVLG